MVNDSGFVVKLVRFALAILLFVRYSLASADVSFALMGDMMLGNALSGANRSDERIAAVRPFIEWADVRFGNLEGPIGGNPSEGKVCSNSKWCHKFSQPADTAATLSKAGVNVVSVINNHALDTGVSGWSETMFRLSAANVAASGMPGKPVIFDVRGTSVGVLAYSANSGLPDWRKGEALKEISELSKRVAILMVSVHAGCEGESNHVVKNEEEKCFGENRGNVVEFARNAIRSGASLVVGHGPHVPRGHEVFAGKLILWSLGNFFTSQGISILGLSGVSPLARVVLSNAGVLKEWDVVSFRQDRNAGLVIDHAGVAAQMVYRKMP